MFVSEVLLAHILFEIVTFIRLKINGVFIFILGVECVQTNMPVNAITISLYRNERSLPYNAIITITCHRGFSFDDGYVSKNNKSRRSGMKQFLPVKVEISIQ